MVDTVDVKAVRDGRYYVVRLQNRSDGTGESGVTKVDISTLTLPNGQVCTKTAIHRAEWAISGMTVRFDWDHTTDDEALTLAGSGSFDWSGWGGNVDPATAGGTGDILLTTIGHVSGSTYDITLWILKKA